jgi:hypothetical protein
MYLCSNRQQQNAHHCKLKFCALFWNRYNEHEKKKCPCILTVPIAIQSEQAWKKHEHKMTKHFSHRMLEGYTSLTSENFQHLVVNHSLHFFTQNTRAINNTNERDWHILQSGLMYWIMLWTSGDASMQISLEERLPVWNRFPTFTEDIHTIYLMIAVLTANQVNF